MNCKLTSDSPRYVSGPALAGGYQYSNRQPYEKLEVDLTPASSTKVPFLIDTKSYFVQGKNAQFPCISAKHPHTRAALLPEFGFEAEHEFFGEFGDVHAGGAGSLGRLGACSDLAFHLKYSYALHRHHHH